MGKKPRGQGSVRLREDSGKYVIDYYDNLGKRHIIHDLRHTFASILIAAGHNLKYIQNQMGHSKIEVTFNLYGHLLQETLESAAQKTEGLVFSSCPAPVPTKKERVTELTATPQINYGSGG